MQAYIGADMMRISPEQQQLIAERWGLDQPMAVRFWDWLGQLLQGNWGTLMVFNQPVDEVITKRFWVSVLDLTVQAGELVAVVGASGSGKSLLAHALLGILPENAQLSGTMIFQGKPLTQKRCEALRGKAIALIPQSVGYLDPLMTVGRQVQRVGQLNGLFSRSARSLMERTFARYDLPAHTAKRYPFQLSGGMARRVLVSTAVMTQAQLVIADEPTPGLHPLSP